MGKIYYVMGKSSSGKDTIYKKLMSDKCLGLKTITGYTTRPMREGEYNGREYYFVNEEKLVELRKKGLVIESRCYDTVYGKWYYFTVDDGNIDYTRNNYILIGTLESYEKLLEYFGEKVMYPLYINVEDGERLERALSREREQDTPKYEEMCRRFLADQKDFSDEKLAKLNITRRFENDNLGRCIEEISICIREK